MANNDDEFLRSIGIDPRALADLGDMAGADSGIAKVLQVVRDLARPAMIDGNAPAYEMAKRLLVDRALVHRVMAIALAGAGALPEAEVDGDTTAPMYPTLNGGGRGH